MDKGSYQLGYPGSIQPFSTEPQPPGWGDNIIGSPNGAFVTSKWWTSLIYKIDGEGNPTPMNIITPSPLNVWSIPDGVGCRQPYFDWPDPLPPLYEGPALLPDYTVEGLGFNEVVATVGITNNGFGVDRIGGAQGYGPVGKYPNTALVEYSTWHVTYDTLFQNNAAGQGSTTAPRLRATAARGSPYMWVEYPDGFPQANPTNYPMLQVQYSNPQAAAPVLYLPNNNFTSTSTQSDWAGIGGTGTQAAGANANAIAFTVNGRNYAAFGPPGTYWTWIYGGSAAQSITKLLLTGADNTSTTTFIVVAALPQNINMATMAQDGTLADLVSLFKTHAFQRPGNTGDPSVANFESGTYKLGTMFEPDYEGSDTVTGTFTYNMIDVGTGAPAVSNETLFALYPHQQANLDQVLDTDANNTQPYGSVYDASYQYTNSRGYATNAVESRLFDDPNFYEGDYNGQMRLVEGTGFVLEYTMPPTLRPVLPLVDFTTGGGDTSTLQSSLKWDWEIAWGTGTVSGNDSYGWAKLLSSVANNYMIAEELNYNGPGGLDDLQGYLYDGLVRWLDIAGAGQQNPNNTQDVLPTGFGYYANWNIMMPYPPGVNTNTNPLTEADGFFLARALNDMHFHLGYFIRAAFVYGKYNPSFVTEYGTMVEHLIRSLAGDYNDQANSATDTAVYPPYRFFDAYIGSSSAGGGQQYSSGENQESWSEAINAWYGMLLWAELTNNSSMSDRAAYMYASETDCSRRYVFNEDAVTSGNFYLDSKMFCNTFDTSNSLANFFQAPGTPANYSTPNFSREGNHALEFLPFGGGSLYLTLNQNGYQKMNYDALVNQPPAKFEGGTQGQADFKIYNDLIYMYQASFDPAGAQQQVNAVITDDPSKNNVRPPPGWLDNGNSLAFLYHWVYSLPQHLGDGHLEVGSSHPFTAVTTKKLFQFPSFNSQLQTSAASNPSPKLTSNTFSSVFRKRFFKFPSFELHLKTYTAYNPSDKWIIVEFSDGKRLFVRSRSHTKLRLPYIVRNGGF